MRPSPAHAPCDRPAPRDAMKPTAPPRLASFLLALAACDGGAPTPDAPPTPPPGCSHPQDALLPDGFGGRRCVRVGATLTEGAAPWPDDASLDGLPGRRVYVQPGAPAGGDGTRERPLPDIARAVALSPEVIVLARGAHGLADTIATRAALALVGTGAAGTIVTLPAGRPGLTAADATAALTLRGLTLRGRASASADEGGVRASGGARVTLGEVRVEGGYDGVSLDGGDLRAERLTVLGSTRHAVRLTGDARAVIAATLLRGAAGGLVAIGGRVHLTRVLADDHRGVGVQLSGSAAARGFVDCRAAPPGDAPGALDCLQEVSLLRNTTVALAVAGERSVELRGAMVSQTRVDAEGAGDGVAVTSGARLAIDPEVRTDAEQGHGTEVSFNGRVGLLLDGDGAARPTAAVVRGARVEGNASAGMFVQEAAVAELVGYSRFARNGAAGLAVTPTGAIGAISCNGFLQTRPATLAAISPGGERVRVEMGDGLAADSLVGVRVEQNDFSGNARFGAVLRGATGMVERNRGRDNRYGLGVYDAPGLAVAASNDVQGRERAPAAAPGLPAALR